MSSTIDWLVAAVIHLELKDCELMIGQPQPQHQRNWGPVLEIENGGDQITDSCEIITYLVSQADYLYLKDILQRAILDQRIIYRNLNIDTGILYPRLQTALILIFKDDKLKEFPPQNLHDIYVGLDWVEKFLGETTYLAGTENLTIADMSSICTMTESKGFVAPIRPNRYPKLCDWVNICMPFYNQTGILTERGLKFLNEILDMTKTRYQN